MSGRDRVTVVGTDTGGGVVIVGILAAAAIFLVLFSIFADRIYSDHPGPSTSAQSFLKSKPRQSRSCKVISLWATASSCWAAGSGISSQASERLEGRESDQTSHRISGQQWIQTLLARHALALLQERSKVMETSERALSRAAVKGLEHSPE